MKNQLIIDTPPGTVFSPAEAETATDADYDRRPLVCVPLRQNRSHKKFCSVLSGPSSLALAALPDDAVLAFNSAHSGRRATLQTHSHRRAGPHERQNAAHPTRRRLRHAGTYVEQLNCLVAARVGFWSGPSW